MRRKEKNAHGFMAYLQRNAKAAKTEMIQKLQPAKPRKENVEVIVEGVTWTYCLIFYPFTPGRLVMFMSFNFNLVQLVSRT